METPNGADGGKTGEETEPTDPLQQ